MSEWYETVGQSDINTSNYFDSYDPAANPIFPQPDFFATDAALIDTRSNTGFWNFGQDKIGNTVSDVIGSDFGKAIGKTGLQLASDSINKNSNAPGVAGQFFRNFRSTQTGAQINAGAYATQLQNFIANPIVWLGAVVLVVAIFFLRK